MATNHVARPRRNEDPNRLIKRFQRKCKKLFKNAKKSFLILLGAMRTMGLIFLRALHHCPIETAARQLHRTEQDR